jgi:hypothetical protein
MMRTVEGVFHGGKVALLETPQEMVGDIPVIVTFLDDTGGIDLRERGIDLPHAVDLRGRLSAFADDWQSPDMDVYDDRYARK